MSDEIKIETRENILQKLIILFQIQNPKAILITLVFSLVSAGLYVLIALIPMPYYVISLFAFGLAPALAIIAVVGAIRGPIAGMITGYFGTFFYNFIYYSAIVSVTLPNLAYGVLGFIVGLLSYDLSNGHSLMKLSILSAVGLVVTTLLTLVIGLTVEKITIIVEIGFIVLPLLTIGIPSVILLTPLYARLWHILELKGIKLQ